ncbi:MAG TPA: NADH-quinone oxidoreductase subunit B family protein [Chitinophagaceae bacterium]|nr:NADH-quinone oxidoreductase subunit B family protein [Chitinophagaceae bacterium]
MTDKNNIQNNIESPASGSEHGNSVIGEGGIPVFPGLVHPTPSGGILVTAIDDVINWARSNSLWPLVFGTSCCAIEMMSTASAKYDWSRFGFEVARATPRQADVIIIAGTIVNKMAPVLRRLYDQMADPKYVIAMGACATSGGPFFYNTYSVVKGADHVIPVDVYIAGCPPRPEALLHSLITLQNKIKAGLTREQIKESSKVENEGH